MNWPCSGEICIMACRQLAGFRTQCLQQWIVAEPELSGYSRKDVGGDLKRFFAHRPWCCSGHAVGQPNVLNAGFQRALGHGLAARLILDAEDVGIGRAVDAVEDRGNFPE